MHLAPISSLLALCAYPIISAAVRNTTDCPDLVLAFSGIVDVALPLSPIVIPGGIRIVEPITSGTFTGPLLNATVSGGLAYPTILEDGTRQDASITIYGITADNSTFLAQISGVGVPMEQYARIELEVGGAAKEKGLVREFLLASIEPSMDRRRVSVGAYVVRGRD